MCVYIFTLIYLLKLDLLQEIALYGYGGWKVQNLQQALDLRRVDATVTVGSLWPREFCLTQRKFHSFLRLMMSLSDEVYAHNGGPSALYKLHWLSCLSFSKTPSKKHPENLTNYLGTVAQGSWYIKLTITQFSLFLPSFFFSSPIIFMSFPDSSVGKESTCNARDPSLIPRSGRSAGEGIGYPLQYSWVSLMVQLVKNSPVIWETWVRSLGWKDTLEKEKATHSSIQAWRIPQSMGSERVGHNWATFTSQHF